MTPKDLAVLIENETTAADHATNAASRARHEGRVEAFSFMLQQQLEARHNPGYGYCQTVQRKLPGVQ